MLIHLSRSILSTSFLLALALCASPERTGAPGSLRGPASGGWELPGTDGEGFAIGSLDTIRGGATIYAFEAVLADQGAACPACFVGLIEGTLDDGIGSGPDFVVEGTYAGLVLDGSGWFDAEVRHPGGAPAGRLQGRFVDPEGGLATGAFRGRWQLRP